MTVQHTIDYTLHLADNALVLGHRNSEWTGHGPILEQDIALSNIALDLIGQARYLYQYAARLMTMQGGPEVTEDVLAYLRDSWDYRNCLLVEQANGDWGKTVLRQFFFSAYQYFFYRELQHSRDAELSAIAEKALKEVTYHLRWSSEWVIRLGDGTEESHARMEKALDQLWMYTGELFQPAGFEQALAPGGIAVDLGEIKPLWELRVGEVLKEATLTTPGSMMQQGGKQGKHTEHLGYLLAEMQFLQRAYPGNEW
ncbi:1,2-phenylacetyl-CoA epoxidase subunit PaaC [Puia dinghuensis]|uniref:Phenylacetic acid degradation protein n=1 Tax=Puia dinghuensis TaxID=1792502 RepID=A0A8J2XVG3_9BACT|nr:1,2-phenylacetyl-CoA epoxidase subunit PaaC [Puia dinghuensis]GGB12120.1 phenylacetic acid degradation protein [Puia dinghuensis]